MKCPNDQTTLVISERQNIEIDYCPQCRGVWLDRGELDKILERSAPDSTPRSEDVRPSRQWSQITANTALMTIITNEKRKNHSSATFLTFNYVKKE